VLDDDDFVTRWRLANYLIIGACYNNDDTKFWSQLDPNYIGIGMGDHCFKNKPVWQTNWNTPGFWDFAKPVRETGFKYIFLDRCVWNIVMNNFKPVLDFVHSILQENGCFLISKSSWKPANDIFIKNQFIKNANPVFKRLPENEADMKVVDLMIQNGNFMITNGYIASIDFIKNEKNEKNGIVDESKTLLLDRKKWKAFMKLKPMIKKN
jgi:hypothetical protein